MDFNFNEIVNRKNTNSIKFDFAVEHGKPENLIPLWVADMDFKTIPEVSEALIKLAKHSVFGYTDTKADYFDAVRNWFSCRHGFIFEPDWLVKTPGVVNSICMTIRAFTDISDCVLIQPPVYNPFKSSITANDRKVVTNPLICENGKYLIDFEDFERKIIENNVKLFILCSPHNPVGRVWARNELLRMGEICLKHDVLIVSDEIHCDFVYDGYKHIIFSSLGDKFLNNSIICTSPGKTFNLAGLQVSNTFIANKNLRERFLLEIKKTGCDMPNMMGLAACQSAYEYGGNWVNALNKYLAKNISFIKDFLNTELQQIKLVDPEGTYLLWLDCNALHITDETLNEMIVHKAGLWINEGTKYGVEGKGFIRINIASPLSVIEKALEQFKKAIDN